MSSDSVCLVEPVSNLLAVLAECKVFFEKQKEKDNMSLGLEDDVEEDAITVLDDTTLLFDVLTEKLSKCDIDDLDFDSVLEFSDSPIGKKNSFYAEIMIGVLEALMLYNFKLNSTGENKTKEVVTLLTLRGRVIDLVKSKTGKTSSRKAGESSRSKSKGSAAIEFHSILRIGSIADFIDTAFYKVADEESEGVEVNILSQSHAFQLYLLTATEHLLSQHKTLLPFERDRQLVHLKSIARMLFFECCSGIGKGDSSDERQTNKMRMCITIVNTLFDMFSKYHKDKLEPIYREITGKTACKDINSLSFTLVKNCQKMLARILNHEESEPLMKDATIILKIIVQVVRHMEHDSTEIQKIFDWFANFAKEQETNHVSLAEEIIKLLFVLSRQLKNFPDIYYQIGEDVYTCLGNLDQSISVNENPEKNLLIINEETVVGVLNVFMDGLDEELALLELSLNKQRAFLITATEHTNADKVEEKITTKIGLLIRSLSDVLSSALPLGTLMDSLTSRESTNSMVCWPYSCPTIWMCSK